MSSYYTKITKAGLAAITAAMNNNTKVPITYMAFGDGFGSVPEPREDATSLLNEVYRVGLNKVEVHSKNPNWLVCEAIIPSAVGGFNIREVALYDNTGNTMLAIASYPPTYKPTLSEGSAKIQTIKIIIQVDNSGNFELIVDPDVVLATVEYVNQQNKNFKFESVNDLIASEKYKDGDFAIVGGAQGGPFIYQSSKALLNDGIFIYNGWTRFTVETGIRPEWAGAPRNGVDDDAAAIRKCIEYCETVYPKRIFFSKTDKNYIASTVDSNNAAFSITKSGITFDFETGNTTIEAKVPMYCMLYFADSAYKFVIRNGTLACNGLSSYGINTNPLKYTPQLKIEGLSVLSPVEDCVYLKTFVADISMLTANGGKRGIVIAPTTNNITTSINLRSCYALNQTVCGYDISVACYCALIACAADNMPLAYKLNIRGGSMIACGAEGVNKLAQFSSFRGLSINGFYSQRCGSTDPENPTPYLMEFTTGRDATLSGFHIADVRNFTYKVGVTAEIYGYECLNITDGSVRRDEAYFVSNYAYSRPIKFAYDDSTQKDFTVNISNIADLRKFITTYLDAYTVNHKLTVQLADGIYNFDLIVSTIQKLNGSGELIIQGNASNRSLVTLQTDYKRLVVKDCEAKVRFKNIKLSSSVSNGSYERLNVDNAKSVWLDNVLIAKDGLNVGVGVRASNGSVVHITNGTVADSTAFSLGIFVKDATSKFIIDSSETAPTTLNWSDGMIVENTNPVNHMGWVFSGGAWKTYGSITA